MSASAAQASTTAEVRLVQAKSGGAAATLTVSAKGRTIAGGGSVAFGQVGGWIKVPAGSAKLSVKSGAGSSQSASSPAAFDAGGSYTVVALSQGSGYALDVLKDASAAPGRARLRVVHAAPELGKPDIRLGHRVIAQGVAFRSASPYVTVTPGSYELAVTKPGGTGTIVGARVVLSAGTATTAIVAGSGGARSRVILASDSTNAPAGAPKTGLGGIASGGRAPWLLALLAALVAGTLGGVLQVARSRHTR